MVRFKSWMERGNCYDNDTVKHYQAQKIDIFYDVGYLGIGANVCKGCPVFMDCIDAGEKGPEGREPGIWGGLSSQQRSRLKKKNLTAIESFLERTKEQLQEPVFPISSQEDVPA